jgi:hypothetical protein
MQARDVKCWVPEAPTECLVSGLRVVRGSPCTAPVSGCWHALTQQSQLHEHMTSRWHIWLMDASLTAWVPACHHPTWPACHHHTMRNVS